MGTSGNPAKKATAAKASNVSDFKKRAKGKPLPLPSGLVVQAKRVDLQTFILSGNVPNPLMEVVSEALEKGQKSNIPSMVGVEEGKIDLQMVNDMYDMVNRVIVASVLNPQVHPLPESEDDRDDDLLYVDEFDDEDKMFVFQWATGGTDDVERFREEARAELASLAEIQGGGVKTQ